MFEASLATAPAIPVWGVGALCRAIADSLQARFNPVRVRGEIAGFSRAASGHCYFSIKDASGQLRCAMFRRAAQGLDFAPRDGDLVELQGQLGVYEQRGDLQLIVDKMQRAGQGNWMEQFLRLKERLQAQGLFDAQRKRPLPAMPRGIGVVTSLGAAALHDVATALQRRAPHVPVVLAPALVQGEQAPASLVAALQQLYARAQQPGAWPQIDAILLVRGGGAMEDLWAFNDETLARTIVQSPVPLISGVGHETDFTIADFCADLRAPTPTAAAELVAPARADCLRQLQVWQERIGRLQQQRLQSQQQWLDKLALRLGQPRQWVQAQRLLCQRQGQQMTAVMQSKMKQTALKQQALTADFLQNFQRQLQQRRQHLALLTQRLELLNPEQVLQRGFAWLATPQGQVVSSIRCAPVGTALQAQLADGRLDLTVVPPRLL
ncbi:Exodeoxyribonuclease 7 large subunit [uncultured Comamonas sp.]|nr:Exodeoxyribonuclease 7 large subunit [uncultured Comamonas sp.]